MYSSLPNEDLSLEINQLNNIFFRNKKYLLKIIEKIK